MARSPKSLDHMTATERLRELERANRVLNGGALPADEAEDDDRDDRPFLVGEFGGPTRKRVGGPRTLTAQMTRMIALMVSGHDWDPSHTPLDIYSAAAAVGYRRKAARHLSVSPIFVDALKAAQAGASIAHHTPSLAEVAREAQHILDDRAIRHRVPQTAQEPPPAVAAPVPPPPALEAPSALQDAERIIYVGRHPDPERYLDLARVAPALLEEPPAPDLAPQHYGLPSFDMTSTIRSRPSPGIDPAKAGQRAYVVQAAPRRSLRRT